MRINLLDILFPRRCLGCGKIGDYICLKCLNTVQLREQKCPECDKRAIDGKTHFHCLKKSSLDGLTTVFVYSSVIKKVIKLLKYRFVHDTAASIVNKIPQRTIDQLKLYLADYVIYPIPLHKDRLKWRGFNQAEKLAQILSKRLNLKLTDNLLIRNCKRIPQADISHREDRINNAKGIFSSYLQVLPPALLASQSRRGRSSCLNARLARQPASTRGEQARQVLVIDDVWTTGATIKEATKILKKMGVKKVWAITIAR